jgi:hypothetical protein
MMVLSKATRGFLASNAERTSSEKRREARVERERDRDRDARDTTAFVDTLALATL